MYLIHLYFRLLIMLMWSALIWLAFNYLKRYIKKQNYYYYYYYHKRRQVKLLVQMAFQAAYLKSVQLS